MVRLGDVFDDGMYRYFVFGIKAGVVESTRIDRYGASDTIYSIEEMCKMEFKFNILEK